MIRAKRKHAISASRPLFFVSTLCLWYSPHCSVQLYLTCTSHTCEQHEKKQKTKQLTLCHMLSELKRSFNTNTMKEKF